jgi:hypothetical protein
MSICGPLNGFMSMLQRLVGMLVSGLMIFFPVVHRGSSVRVRGEFVKFGSSLVRPVRHSVSPLFYSLHLKTTALFKVFNIEHLGRGYPL